MAKILSFKRRITKQPALFLGLFTVLSFPVVPCSAQIPQQGPVCGYNAEGFNAWKAAIYRQAVKKHIGKAGLNALMKTYYVEQTIAADRNQRSFKLSFGEFMQKRGANIIIQRGRVLKQQKAALFAAIESRFGVPAGPLLAIWGMETGFGHYMGKQNTISAVASLAYDCRRTEFFTEQLYAALQLIDKGQLQAQSVGALHGEIGHTQFLPLNVLYFGVDGDGDGKIDLIGSIPDALASTAHFLQSRGWQAGKGYQPGEANFPVLQKWNKAKVYQRALAVIGQKIDD